jgi:hypothetical protein
MTSIARHALLCDQNGFKSVDCNILLNDLPVGFSCFIMLCAWSLQGCRTDVEIAKQLGCEVEILSKF